MKRWFSGWTDWLQERSSSVVSPLGEYPLYALALEGRMMFDGALAKTFAEEAEPMESAAPLPGPADGGGLPEAGREAIQDLFMCLAAPATPEVVWIPREVVFIDGGVAEGAHLAAAVQPGVVVFFLDPHRNGLEQMVASLAGYQGLEAIHLVSHGRPGEVQVGNLWLSSGNMAENSSLLHTLGNALGEQGDLLLYGCASGQGAVGAELVAGLARATGADVAASTDPTGARWLGGDWELERVQGAVTAKTALFGAAGESYGQLLSSTLVFDQNLSLAENSQPGDQVGPILSPNPPSVPIYKPSLGFAELAGGTGAALFDVTPSGTIMVASGANLDFEVAPSDGYTLNVQVTDGTLTETAIITIQLLDVYEISPVVTSLGTARVAERTQGTVYTATASRADSGSAITTWTLGGADKDRFTVDGQGRVSFVSSPDFKSPTDQGLDNVYDITVQAADGGGNSSTSRAVSITVYQVNAPPSGSLVLDGTPTQGETLGLSSTLTDADGMGEITYYWQADGRDIAGATGTTFLLTEASVGKTITAAARYTDGRGTAESKVSAALGPVVNVNDSPTGAVTIAGTPTEGQLLEVANTLGDLDGLGTIAYQWRAGGVEIAGAVSSTYRLTKGEVGKSITVVASYTDDHGALESVVSQATSQVAGAAIVNHPPTGEVTIAGDLIEGKFLTAVDTLEDLDGLGAITYQWHADGVDIAGAVGSTYQLTENEVGKSITVVAFYTDGLGTQESVTSQGTSLVADEPDSDGGDPPVDPTDGDPPVDPTDGDPPVDPTDGDPPPVVDTSSATDPTLGMEDPEGEDVTSVAEASDLTPEGFGEPDPNKPEEEPGQIVDPDPELPDDDRILSSSDLVRADPGRFFNVENWSGDDGIIAEVVIREELSSRSASNEGIPPGGAFRVASLEGAGERSSEDHAGEPSTLSGQVARAAQRSAAEQAQIRSLMEQVQHLLSCN